MLDRLLIEKKLRKIEEFLRELEEVEIRSFDEFRVNTVLKRFVERNMELAVEQMVDVCKHFVAGLDLNEPETYAECFEILAKERIIPGDAVGKFKSMVRFRNILIHVYDGIDDSITYGVYTKHLDDFRAFIRNIRAYLLNSESA